MLLRIRHTTAYRFAEPMRYVVQRHRLSPSAHAGQTVERWSVSADRAIFGAFYTDAAGDRVRTMTLAGPITGLDVVVEGAVRTTDTNGILTGHPERVPPMAYLRETRATEIDDAILALADAVSAPQPLARAHALSAAVTGAVAYRTGVTDAATTAAQALATGEGVCQDHAHLLIAAARAAGLPARYVTGYLLTSDEAVTGEAGHAWAEIHIPDLGWTGFDPSNACCPDDRYVRLGSGLDAADAAPIRGASFGLSAEALDVAVAVEAVQQ